MIKARSWPVRAMYMLVAFALVISLMITAAPAQSVMAQDGMVYAEWERAETPTKEDWVLAPKSTIIDYAVPDGGEVAYAIVLAPWWMGKVDAEMEIEEEIEEELTVENGGVSFLLKSTDHAATWKDITAGIKKEVNRVTDWDPEATEVDAEFMMEDHPFTLIKVACDPSDADFVAVALSWPHMMNGGEMGPAQGEELHVLISNNGGTSFRDTGEVGFPFPDGILDLAVAPEVNGMRNIAIGGSDNSVALLFRCLAIGDIGTGWIDATAYDGWDDEGGFDSIAVVDIHFAPSWATDNTILVATTTNTSVYLQSGTWGTVEAWNSEAGFADAVPVIAGTGVLIPSALQHWAAGINTPSDYGRHTTKRYVWVNVNYWDTVTGKAVGKIFRVINASVNAIDTQLPGMPWLSNVSYLGTIASGKAIASLLGTGGTGLQEPPTGCDGLKTVCCEGVQVYRNGDIADMEICCLAWKPSCKPPTGKTIMEAFYVTPEKAYAVALWGYWRYDEGAWSWTYDDGETWNQLSLIDTRIDYLSDVAVSPNCNKLMLVSINYKSYCGCDSVWYRAETPSHGPEYSGKWMRTWCGKLLGEDELGMLRLAPEETNGETVYLIDYGTGTVYWNDLQTLACWEWGTATVDNIVDLAVKDKDTIFALDYDGSVAMSTGHGDTPTWSKSVDSKVDYGYTIAVWGDDILVGGEDGEVSHSADGGETFTEITEPQEAKLPIEGYVTVAFDSYFDANGVIYAAVESDYDWTGGIYRWIIDESSKWYDMRAMPTEWQATYNYTSSETQRFQVAYTGLVLDNADGNPMTSAATGGVLYATYVGYVDSYWVTGVARQLTPAMDFCCDETDWDFLHVGLTQDECCFWEEFYAWPKALKICGCLTPDSNSHLFAIDNHDYDMSDGREGTVWTFEDCYAKHAPDLSAPTDGWIAPADPCDCDVLPFHMRWNRLCDACDYDIQVAMDSAFTDIVLPVSSITPIPAVSPSYLFTGGLVPGVTYYWRTRVVKAETGQEIRSWWSTPRSFTIAPFSGTGVVLSTPESGATNVPRTKIAFTWSALTEVDSYNWVLSPNADLSSPVDSQTGITGTGHTFTGTLAYDTPYYWRVTGIRDGAANSMAMGTFRTMAEPVTPPEPEPVKTPVWVWVIIAIGSVLVIVVIVLIFRTRRV